MEANGVELGNMNMLLLKKIEELTLHLIEQKNRLNQQQMMPSKLKYISINLCPGGGLFPSICTGVLG